MKTFLAVLLEKIRFQACGARGGQRLRSGVAAQQQTHVAARGGCKRGNSPSCRCFGVGFAGNKRDHKWHEHCHQVISTAGSPQSSPHTKDSTCRALLAPGHRAAAGMALTGPKEMLLLAASPPKAKLPLREGIKTPRHQRHAAASPPGIAVPSFLSSKWSPFKLLAAPLPGTPLLELFLSTEAL